MEPAVSVIIVNYAGESLIGPCLQALEGQTFRDFEIIIVDNASPDGSLEEISRFLGKNPKTARVTVVPLERNVGFASGNAEGLTKSRGKYIALLNNDTEPHPAWLQELVRTMEGNPNAGMCASKMVSRQNGAIDSAGDGYTTALRGYKRGEGEAAYRFNEPCEVFGACAGAALYRREMVEEIGFLDEDFFLIHEDTDLNLRARLAGWKTLFVPGAVVVHRVTSSIGYMSDTQVYYTLRNAEFARMKNIPFLLFLLCLPGFILGVFSEFFFFALRKKRPLLYFRAKKDALKGLPRMWRKRKWIMENRRIDNISLWEEMTPLMNKAFLRAKWRKLIGG